MAEKGRCPHTKPQKTMKVPIHRRKSSYTSLKKFLFDKFLLQISRMSHTKHKKTVKFRSGKQKFLSRKRKVPMAEMYECPTRNARKQRKFLSAYTKVPMRSGKSSDESSDASSDVGPDSGSGAGVIGQWGFLTGSRRMSLTCVGPQHASSTAGLMSGATSRCFPEARPPSGETAKCQRSCMLRRVAIQRR